MAAEGTGGIGRLILQATTSPGDLSEQVARTGYFRTLMDAFFEHHRDAIRFRYRCFDRILLNGLIQPFQQPERVVGFFGSYRKQYPVSRHLLRGIAEQFHS